MKLQEIYIQINHQKFYFLKNIFEGYDGMAMISSHAAKEGVVRLRFPEEQTGDVYNILNNLVDKIKP